MKKILTPIIMILFATLTIALIPTEAEAAIYEDTVRLHILAPSDSTEDQALKFAVRDLVLKNYSEQMRGAVCAEDAVAKITELIPIIESDIKEFLEEGGYGYTVSVCVGEEWYGTREYKNFTLPMGEYASLIITLGEGEGQNWWCVMYPPLCLDIATSENTGYTEEERGLITRGGYRVKFKLLELLSGIGR